MTTIWPITLGVASIAGLAGAFVVPAARKIAFGEIEHDWLNREIEFDHFDADGRTVVCKSGLLVRVYKLRGEAYETKPRETQQLLHKGRSDLINEIGTLGVSCRFFGIKRLKDISHPASWQSKTLEEIGEAEAKVFQSAYEISWYMVLTAKEYRPLEDLHEKITSLFKIYEPQLLTASASSCCRLTCFLNYLICGDLREDLRAVSSNISGNLQAADTIWDKEQGTMTAHIPMPYTYKVIAVQAWTNTVSGELLHDIMKVRAEIEVSQILLPIRKEKISAILARKAREVHGNPWGNKALGLECEAAVELLSEGSTAFFDTQFTINVRATNLLELDNAVESVTSVLSKAGIRYSVETSCMAVDWFNRLPGRDRLPRPLKLRNEDVAAIWAFQFAPVGLIKSYWGNSPVRSFATASGQAYAFQFQTTPAEKALGNYLVIAPSGVGKSTLIMHLLGGLAKWKNFKSFILDSKEGARFMIEAMGGVYQSYDKLALNPLDTPEDNLAIRQHISKIVRTMIGNVDKEDNLDDILNHLLNTAFQIPCGERTFNSIFDMCFSPQTSARESFAKWVTNKKGAKGFYSHIFNSPRDTLSDFLGQAFMVGINMNEALEDELLAPPVVTHITTAIERVAKLGTLKGFAIFIDEAANLLRNETFKNHAQFMYREYRKLGGAVGMAFQDPSALFKSGVADAVIENTSCFFFFPNPQGNREAYDAFRLNDEQKAFIWGGGLEGRKVLLVKRDAGTGFEESVILDVDLSSLGEALRFYRSGPDAVRQLQQLQNQWGDEWLAKLKL